MPTFQRDELLTQSEILEKETLPPAKEAYQHSEEQLPECCGSPKLQPTVKSITCCCHPTTVLL
jgi:hypothetical protein